jgi:hypothetical protein
MDWLRTHNQNPGLSASSVIMVDIGNGLLPDSDWWMVYVGGAQLEKEYWMPWLYDQSTGEWIGHGLDNVEWTGERLARGHAAQDRAISCLS